MAKRRVESGKQAEPHQIYKVGKAGIKIYPVGEGTRMYIEVDNNGRIKKYDKALKPDEINDALAKTIIYFYNQLITSENGKPKPTANKGNNNS